MAKLLQLLLCLMLLFSVSCFGTCFASSLQTANQHLHQYQNGNYEKIGIYQLKRGNFSVKFTNFGARIISVILPDRYGKLADVALGYDSVKEYLNDRSYFGPIVGRVANRIGGAQFTYNGIHYKLVANEGKNMLHGGPKGFANITWKVDKYQPRGRFPYITFTYFSLDGEAGFPGNLKVKTTYKIVDDYELSIAMTGKPLNKVTPVNLAHHTYWNLGGHNNGNILGHEVQIFGSQVTLVDKELIPTGEIKSVKRTPYDFLKPHTVGSRIKGLPNGGYDINYVLDVNKTRAFMKPVAVVRERRSGRVLKLWTNKPGMQFYTGNFLRNLTGKGGYVYQRYAGLALETLGFPDAVNHPNFPSVMVHPGEKYEHYMLFKFSTMR